MNVTRIDKDEFSKPLVNRVAQSGLVTINLEKFLPQQEILELDLKDFLFRGLLLKEKEFHKQIAEFDWSRYNDSIVAVHCSTDAIIQKWAFMLVASKLISAKGVYYGTKEEVEDALLIEAIRVLDNKLYVQKRVIIKGCSDKEISHKAYLEISKKMLPVVKSLMFGEACSTVPIYKQKK